MSVWAPRRFWDEVAVAESPAGWAVLLDGRRLRTPGKAELLLPSRALAALVAAEWQAQGRMVDPASMPATRMANSAIDRVAPQQGEVVTLLAAYGGSDLLCHRAPGPERLIRRQRAWDAPLAWVERELGVRLTVAEGVMPVDQPLAALTRLSAAVAALPPFELAPFHELVVLSGSLVLALAIERGALDPEEGWRLSRIDEDYEAEVWGHDADAVRAASRRSDEFLFACRFLRAARS